MEDKISNQMMNITKLVVAEAEVTDSSFRSGRRTKQEHNQVAINNNINDNLVLYLEVVNSQVFGNMFCYSNFKGYPQEAC